MNIRVLCAATLLASAATATSTSARADPAENEGEGAPTKWPAAVPDEGRGHSGFAMSAGAGVSLPMGDSTGVGNDSLSQAFSSQVPLMAEIGANVTPSWFVGVYGTYGLGSVGSATDVCAQNVSCSAHSVHVGASIAYRFSPGQKVEPWIGYGIGYESETATLDGPGGHGSLSLTGFELAHLRLGVDFLTTSALAIGPFVDLGVGQFGHEAISSPTINANGDIQNGAVHEWMTLGVRVVVMP